MTDGGASCSGGCLLSGLGVLTLGAGAYKGFMDAQGLPVEPDSLEFAVNYGGIMLQGGMGFLVGYLGGGVTGAVGNYLFDITESASEAFKKTGLGVGTVTGVVGVTKAALESIVGYGIGYGIGYLTR